MYPFERFMKVLKGHVKIVQDQKVILLNVIFQNCSKYFKQASEVGIRYGRNQEMENDLILGGRPIFAGKSIILSDELLQIAHHYLLFNSSEVQPYVELHLQELRSSDRRLSRNHNQLQKRHIDTFIVWFSDKIIDEIKCNASCVSNTLKWFAHGPRDLVMSFNGYIINGLGFTPKRRRRVDKIVVF
ncbi:hypothetical protein ACOSP7_004295 [Xanthoceras sorbifolium]